MVRLTKTFIFALSLSLCSCGGTPGKLASLAEKAKTYIGYEDEIVDKASQMAENFLKNGIWEI